jgi:hypothetical protein
MHGDIWLLLQAAKHLQLDFLVWISYLNYLLISLLSEFSNGCTAPDYDTKASCSLPTSTRVPTHHFVPNS